MLIEDETIRSHIDKALSTLQKRKPEFNQGPFGFALIDEMGDLAVSKSDSARKETREHLGTEISLANLGVLTLGAMAAVVGHPSVPPVLPVDWLSADGKPDPNLALDSLLVNNTNLAWSIVQLVESGLEPSARILLRNFLELSWITIVVASDKEKMRIYAQDLDDNLERKNYHKHFSANKLITYLTSIEQKIGFPDEVREDFKRVRTHHYRFFSKTVHSAYTSIVLGVFGFDLEGKFSLFGAHSDSSRNTLYTLSEGIFFLAGVLVHVLKTFHQLKPPFSREWQEVLALEESFMYSFLRLAFERQKDSGE